MDIVSRHIWVASEFTRYTTFLSYYTASELLSG